MINFRKFLRSRVSITKRSCFDIVLATNYRYVNVLTIIFTHRKALGSLES